MSRWGIIHTNDFHDRLSPNAAARLVTLVQNCDFPHVVLDARTPTFLNGASSPRPSALPGSSCQGYSHLQGQGEQGKASATALL